MSEKQADCNFYGIMSAVLECDVHKYLEYEKNKVKRGIAFVFSEQPKKENPQELSEESKERLNKAFELYKEGAVSYFLLSGGEFAPGLRKPFAKMMADYLVEKQKQALLMGNSSIESDYLSTELDKFQKSIFEERHSKTTSDNIIFGHHLLNLLSQEEIRKRRDLPELEEWPIYYVSSGYHLNRIKNILEARGFNRYNDVFASSGRDNLSNDSKRAIKEYAHRLIVLVDPKGEKLPFEKWLRRTRTHPISHEDMP